MTAPATYLAYWPVHDDAATLVELVDEAVPELRRMLELRGLIPLARPSWQLVDAAEAGWNGEPPAAGLLLTVELDVAAVDVDVWDKLAPVEPVVDLRREAHRARVAAVARLTELSDLSADEIAVELGCSRRTVERARAEAGVRGRRTAGAPGRARQRAS